MSTHYDGCLFRKRNNEWEIIDNINMDCVKNMMDGWNIDADAVYDVDDKLISLSKEIGFTSYEYLGRIEKEKVPTNISIENYIYNADSLISENKYMYFDVNPMLFYKKDYNVLESIIDCISKYFDTDTYIKLSKDEKTEHDDKYYSVYVEVKHNYNGKLYGIHSFDNIIKNTKKKLKGIKKCKNKWEEISTSLDYLKLTSEEKDNIWSSFEYEINDEDNFFKYRLESAEMLKNTLTLFSNSFDEINDVYFYIYDDSNYAKEKLPEWLNDKIGGF